MHVLETIVTIGLVACGCCLALVPAKYLLRVDACSGRWIYTQELKASGDEHKAIAKAAVFYRTFGICMIVVALSAYISVLVTSGNSR